MLNNLVTIDSAAKKLGVPATWLRRQVKAGNVPSVRIGQGTRVDPGAIADAINARAKYSGPGGVAHRISTAMRAMAVTQIMFIESATVTMELDSDFAAKRIMELAWRWSGHLTEDELGAVKDYIIKAMGRLGVTHVDHFRVSDAVASLRADWSAKLGEGVCYRVWEVPR